MFIYLFERGRERDREHVSTPGGRAKREGRERESQAGSTLSLQSLRPG